MKIALLLKVAMQIIRNSEVINREVKTREIERGIAKSFHGNECPEITQK